MLVYIATPKGTDSRVQCTIEAGIAAARASGLCQVRKIRSTTYISVTEPELMTSGRATRSSSRRLPGAGSGGELFPVVTSVQLLLCPTAMTGCENRRRALVRSR